MTAFIAIVFIVLFGVALLGLLSAIALYARLARLREAVRSSRSAIDAELKGSHKPKAGSVMKGEFPGDIRDAVWSHNELVGNYNAEISAFPSNIIAALFKFEKIEPFGIGD